MWTRREREGLLQRTRQECLAERRTVTSNTLRRKENATTRREIGEELMDKGGARGGATHPLRAKLDIHVRVREENGRDIRVATVRGIVERTVSGLNKRREGKVRTVCCPAYMSGELCHMNEGVPNRFQAH